MNFEVKNVIYFFYIKLIIENVKRDCRVGTPKGKDAAGDKEGTKEGIKKIRRKKMLQV